MSKRGPLQRLFPKGSRKSYKLQSAKEKDSGWQYVAATGAEQGVHAHPRPHGRSNKPTKDQHRGPAKQTRKGSAPLLDNPTAGSRTPRHSLQQELQLPSSGRGEKNEQDPETASLDSVSRILAECADSDTEDKSLHGQMKTADLDREVLRLLHEEASSESDEEDGSRASLTRIDVEHGHTPLVHSDGSLAEGEEGGRRMSDALYILYGPDQRRSGEKLKNCNASQTSSGEGSPQLPLHPMSIQSGTLEAGSEIYIDLQDGEKDPTGKLSTSTSSSEDEDQDSSVERAHLPKPLAQELDEAQRPPSASRKSERRQGVVHPSMEEMKLLLETLADTESNFSSISSSNSGMEQVETEQSGGSGPQQGGVAAGPLVSRERTSQQNDTRESLTFEMLAMTRSEVSLTDSNSEEEEAGIDAQRKGIKELTPKIGSNPATLTNGKITLDMLATDSSSKSSLVSMGSEDDDHKSSPGGSKQEGENEHREEVDFGNSPSQSDPLDLQLTGQHLPHSGRILMNGDNAQDVSERQAGGREDMGAFLETEPESKGRVLPRRRNSSPIELEKHEEETEMQQRAQGLVYQQEQEATSSNHPCLISSDLSPLGSSSPDLGNSAPDLPTRSDPGAIPDSRNGGTTSSCLRLEDSTSGTTVLPSLRSHPEQTVKSPPEELPKASASLQPQKPGPPTHHEVAVSPQEARNTSPTVPHEHSSLRPPQVFSGLLSNHAPPQVPKRPPRRLEGDTAGDPNSELTHPQTPAPLPTPVPKPRKSLPTVPMVTTPLEQKEGTTSQSETAEIQVHLKPKHTQITTRASKPGTSDVETPQKAEAGGLPALLYEKIAQLEERQRVMTEAFQMERESLWSVISQQAQVIQRMHTTRVSDRKWEKTYHKRFRQRVEAVDLGVLSVGRECASLESRLVAMETTQRSLLETLSRTNVPQAAGEEMSSQAAADVSPRQRQRKISLLSEHKVTKLKKFFGDNPPLLELFLKRLGYEQYLPRFLSERIGLLELPHISEQQLVSLGIPMGPRLRIMNEAQLL